MPAQLLEHSSSQIPRSGEQGFLAEDIYPHSCPLSLGAWTLGTIEGVLWTFPRWNHTDLCPWLSLDTCFPLLGNATS